MLIYDLVGNTRYRTPPARLPCPGQMPATHPNRPRPIERAGRRAGSCRCLQGVRPGRGTDPTLGRGDAARAGGRRLPRGGGVGRGGASRRGVPCPCLRVLRAFLERFLGGLCLGRCLLAAAAVVLVH